MNEEHPIDKDAEKIFDLRERNNHLRDQITYLQEQISIVEGEIEKIRDRYELIIEGLEQALGDALYKD